MPAKPIIAYAITKTGGGGVVHKDCLHQHQAAARIEMESRSTNVCPRDYPGVQSAWHPGHPSLPQTCAHCGKTIERGTEVA